MTRLSAFRLQPSSIRFSLLLLVLLTVLPALGLTFYTNLDHRRILAFQARESTLRLVRLASANQQRLIDGAHILLVALARLPAARDAVACNGLFADMMKQYPSFINLGVAELNGDVSCSAVPFSQKVNIADRPYFRRALQTRGFAVGDYQIGRITGAPTLNLGYPIIDAAGRIQAVVFVALDLAWLNKFVPETQLPDGTALVVTDSAGTILARYPDPEKWIGRSMPEASVVKAMLVQRGEGTAEAAGVDGVPRLHAFAPLGAPGQAGGAYVAIGIPKAVAFAEADQLLARNLGALGLVALLALAAVMVGNRFVLRRVDALVSATRRLSAGDLTVRTGLPHENGELSELARAFDETAETLQRQKAETDQAGEALRRSADRLEMLHKIDQDILTAQSLESVAAAALRHIWNLVHYRRASFMLFDFEANEARALASHAINGRAIEPGTRLPLDTLGDISAMLSALRQGKVYELDIQSLSRQVPAVQAALAEGVRTTQAIPLIAEAQLIGALNFSLTSTDVLTPEDLDIAREAADQVAIAIQQAGLRQNLQRHAAELEQRVVERTAALREASMFLENLLATSPGVVYRRRPGDLTMTYVSGNVERVLGYAAEEIVGVPKFWMERIHPDDRAQLDAQNERAWAEKQTQIEREYRFLHKDGQYRWLDSAVRFEYDEAGNLLEVFGFVLDTSRRKQAEEALQNARQEADRANQAKSEFLSRMSHELRTPLNAVLGFAQLLEMDSLNPDQRKKVGHIHKGGRHLLELINEVLDIARVEAGHLAISLEPVPVRVVLQEVMDLVVTLAADRDIGVVADGVGGPDRHVVADRQRLKQVLLNLLANAVKYNRTGGRVTLSSQETSAGRLRICVTDTGVGISPEQMQRLFTPFDRLGAEQTSVEGTGLGLVLSKRLVEAMRGTMGVESIAGKGSTFWVEFAAVEGPLQRLNQEGTSVPAPSDPGASKETRTVVYVEDNLSNLEVVQYLLTHRPEIKLLPAMQGRMGLDLAREHHPDLILLDVHLPDMRGDEVLRRLQEDPATRHIPVIVISADATSGQIERLMAAGARAYLTKPLDVKEFLDVLDATLGERVH